MVVPEGPGVRWDAGIVEGDTIAGAFDSMIAKLIVTGRTREQAIERSRRVLDELVIEGVPTVTPVPPQGRARSGLRAGRPGAPFTVHTRWIETEFDNDIAPYAGPAGEAAEAEERQNIVVEVGGKRVEVSLPGGLSLGGGGGAAAKKKAPRRSRGRQDRRGRVR
jgi:acetyl-CoA/propionyl-CoA carboxylase biotin carboxyl carrier protein